MQASYTVLLIDVKFDCQGWVNCSRFLWQVRFGRAIKGLNDWFRPDYGNTRNPTERSDSHESHVQPKVQPQGGASTISLLYGFPCLWVIPIPTFYSQAYVVNWTLPTFRPLPYIEQQTDIAWSIAANAVLSYVTWHMHNVKQVADYVIAATAKANVPHVYALHRWLPIAWKKFNGQWRVPAGY